MRMSTKIDSFMLPTDCSGQTAKGVAKRRKSFTTKNNVMSLTYSNNNHNRLLR